MVDLRDLRDFLFRGLTFESEAERFREAGIKVGADLAATEEALLADALVSFDLITRNQALRMARLYAVMYCFENGLRELVRQALAEAKGASWWDTVPSRVRKNAESRQAESAKNSWLAADKRDVLSFADFGDLASIITGNWECFEDLIPSQHWLTQRMSELEDARNFIAHNRILDPGEFDRVYMYVADWNRQIGL